MHLNSRSLNGLMNVISHDPADGARRKTPEELRRIRQWCMRTSQMFASTNEGTDVWLVESGQRTMAMRTRDVASKICAMKPVVLSQHAMLGLKHRSSEAERTMDPDDDVFMDDSVDEIRRKIHETHCVEYCTDDVEDDPVFEYVKHVLMLWYDEILLCGKPYRDVDTIKAEWMGMDKRTVKEDVVRLIDLIVDIARTEFASSAELTALEERVVRRAKTHSN